MSIRQHTETFLVKPVIVQRCPLVAPCVRLVYSQDFTRWTWRPKSCVSTSDFSWEISYKQYLNTSQATVKRDVKALITMTQHRDVHVHVGSKSGRIRLSQFAW